MDKAIALHTLHSGANVRSRRSPRGLLDVIAAHPHRLPRMTTRRSSIAGLASLELVLIPNSASAQGITTTAVTPAVRGRPMMFEDFATMPAVSDPQLSPDGSRVLYAVRTTDIAANKRTTRTFVVGADGGTPRQIPDTGTAAREARWSPDGKWIVYASGDQLWIADANGGGKRQLTTLNGGASGPMWAPMSDRIAFTSAVYPDCKDDACNVGRAKERAESKVKAHVADQLLYRHWTAWDEGTRSHLYVVPVTGGAPTDLTADARYDVPPAPFGGSEGYAWSPDGREIAYSAKDQGRADAWSTDVNLYVVPADGSAPAVVITAANRGDALAPLFGDIAYISVGNEVGVYLTTANAWPAYTAFYNDAVAYIHAKAPAMRVGVTTIL
jgi:Tol biopolymer transport system component